LRIKDDVNGTPFTEDGLVGYLYTPTAEGTYPALLILGGSDGGIDIPKAAMLASHGYVTLALDYFGDPPLPAELSEIPLEYFKTAIDWLQAQENVDADKIGVVGVSRGGELALLLGATYPEITAVVGYVPSGVVWGNYGKTNSVETSAWTLDGIIVPYATSDQDIEKAIIPVEQINGPILLISGKDDHVWPSAPLSEIAITRLQETKFAHSYEHLSYEGAGHLISVPYWPTTGSSFTHPVSHVEMTMGGTPQGDATASADSWAQVLTFLEDAFGNPSP
jgi:dienelactone hydrolase